MATASNSSESPVVGGGSAKSRRDRNVKLRSVSKYMLFTINCVTLICGLILFFLGVVLQTQYATYFEFLDGSFYNVSLWCLVVGVIVCLVSFLGLFGSIREDYCTLLAFSIILSLVIAFEICLGVSAFAMAQENRLASTVADKMQESLDNYGRRDHEGVTKVWDILQTDFDCCGVSFPGDWSMTYWARSIRKGGRGGDGAELPSSCCAKLALDSDECAVTSPDRHSVGCIDALSASSRKNAGTLGAIACLLGAGQILLVVAACCLMKRVNKPKACPPFY